MKNVLLPAAGALAIALASTTPAFADTLTLEGRMIDYDGDAEANEFRAEYTHRGYILRTGAELSHTFSEDVTDNTKIAGNAAVEIQAPAGIVISPRAEIGYMLREGDGEDGAFWGLSMSAYRDFGPLTASVSTRHREGFDDGLGYDEDRLGVGLRYNLNDHHSIGLNYYATDAGVDSQAIGISYRLAI